MPDSSARTIAALASLPYTDRHVGAHYAPVHRTDELQIGIYILDPGGRIPPRVRGPARRRGRQYLSISFRLRRSEALTAAG